LIGAPTENVPYLTQRVLPATIAANEAVVGTPSVPPRYAVPAFADETDPNVLSTVAIGGVEVSTAVTSYLPAVHPVPAVMLIIFPTHDVLNGVSVDLTWNVTDV
jgi:hypothetical protein